MTEPVDAAPEPPEGLQRRHFGDQRDDFDDEFGRIRTPAEIARRKLRVPAIMHIVCASVCLAGTAIGAGASIYNAFDNPYGGRDPEDEIIGGLVLALFVLTAGGFLFGTVFVGGVSMIRLKRRRIALIAAFIVTGLSLAGPYGILFYPFGIWALILLYSESVKREFEAPAASTPKLPSEPKQRFSNRMLLIAGQIGCPIMLFIFAMTAWDAYVYPRYWSTSEIFWCLGISFIIACMFAAMIVHALKTRVKLPSAKPAESPSTIDRDD